MYITSFSEKEIFCLYLFFSPESSSLMVFSVWLGNHAFVSFLGYSADIPCHVLCSDRAAGKWETLFLKEKTRQVAWPLKKGKKNARLLKTTNSSSTRWFAPKQCILGVWLQIIIGSPLFPRNHGGLFVISMPLDGKTKKPNSLCT